MRDARRVSPGLIVLLLVGLLGSLPGPAGVAKADGGIKVGVLHCRNVPGTRSTILIQSTVEISCKFVTPDGTEAYRGETGIALGIDLNITKTERMAFTVLMGTSDTSLGGFSLEGRYYGVKASATVGGGAGVAILVGGGDKNVTLQPLALEGSYGLGVAAGVGYLYLRRDATKS